MFPGMVLEGPASSNLLWLLGAPLLPQGRPDCPLLFLEPWALLAPEAVPAADRVLIFSLQCPLKGSIL